MSSNNNEQLDLSGLTQAQRDGLVVLERQLKTIIGAIESDIYKNLTPAVRKRVAVLRDIQREHDELEAKFFEERAALEAKKSEHDELEAKFFEERTALDAKYQKLYAPLYLKRYDIVTGVVEVDGAKEEGALDKTDDTEKGVPDFWLTAMKNNEITTEEITERDEEALKYLKNIKWCRMDDPKGFKLEFFFETNPFFTNSVLTKVYHVIDDDEPILEKAIGMTIEWLPGKCLTQKILKIKPKKGSKKAKPIIKTKDCESFFNFFSPPEVPDDAVEAEELQNQKEQDYAVGSTIRDKIIPHAVSWFTGEAKEVDKDEEETKMRSLMMMLRMQEGGKTAAGGEAERPPECKQQ